MAQAQEKQDKEKAIREAPRPIKDDRAAELPYGEGRIDAALFNGVHRNENDGRPSVDTGHRLHAVMAAKARGEETVPAMPTTSIQAVAQDIEAAKATAKETGPALVEPEEIPKVEGKDTKKK